MHEALVGDLERALQENPDPEVAFFIRQALQRMDAAEIDHKSDSSDR